MKFLGVQSDTSVWYQAMDVFVMPSLFEGLPVVGMEAQASGLPCVFSTGVTEEVLLRPDSCRISLEQPDEAWAAVLKDADRNLPDRAQAAAQVRAAGYDIRQETLRLQQLYTGLIAKRVPHMPEISMIVPVYNVEQYLPAALDSLRAQTCPDWEAILVDDGSPDGCGALCDAAARQDARFRVIHQKNAGVGAARNAGLAAARGTYVQFLDSDDALEPQMVEVLCRTAKQTDADLILFGGYEEHYAADGTRTGCTDIAPVLEGYTGATLPAIVPAAVGHVAGHAAAVPPPLHRRGELPLYRLQDRGGRPVFVSFYRQHLHCVVGIPEKLYRYKLRASGSASQSYHPERLTDNFYLSDAVEAVARDWGLNDDPACRRAVNHSRVLDLQLGIKNVCLGPLSFRQRTAWLRQALRIPAVRAAVRDMPLQDARSRNDRIKLALLKVRLCAAVIALSSWNNRR